MSDKFLSIQNNILFYKLYLIAISSLIQAVRILFLSFFTYKVLIAGISYINQTQKQDHINQKGKTSLKASIR